MALCLCPLRHGITNFLTDPFQPWSFWQRCPNIAPRFRRFCHSKGPGYLDIINRATIGESDSIRPGIFGTSVHPNDPDSVHSGAQGGLLGQKALARADAQPELAHLALRQPR